MPEESILKAFLTLGVVVAALGIVLYVIKKYASKAKKATGGMNIQVVSKISLQPKTHLFIVNAGKKTLLLGATDHGVNTLADLTDNPDPAGAIELAQKDIQQTAGDTITNGFKVNHLKKAAPVANIESDSLSFSSFLKSTFKKQTN